MLSHALRPQSRLSRKGIPPLNADDRLALFFALATSKVAVSSSASPSVSHALKSGGLVFQDFDGTGESWMVTGCDGPCADPLVIPSIVNDKPVVGIGGSAFWFDNTLAEVQIPASVTTIDGYAFGGSSATTFSVDPLSEHFKSVRGMLLTKDGTELVAYPGGATATSVTVPTGVKKLRIGSFYGDALTSVSLPASLEVIEQQVFNLPGLLTIELPISLSTIGMDAFGPSMMAFAVTAGNPNFKAIDGVLFTGNELFAYPKGKTATSYQIPAGTTTITDSAFDENNVLASISIPISLTSFSSNPFRGLSSLESVTVEEGHPTLNGVDGVLFRGTALVTYPKAKTGTRYSVPAGTTAIGESAFMSAPTLTTITLPDSVTVIGSEAFAYSPNLTSINLPSGLVSFGDYILIYTKITCVVVPHTVTNWGYRPFGYNRNPPDTVCNFYFEGDAPPEGLDLGLPSGAIVHRIEGTKGWPASSVTALARSVRVTANRGSAGLPTPY